MRNWQVSRSEAKIWPARSQRQWRRAEGPLAAMRPRGGERCHAPPGHVSGDDPDSLPEAALAGDRSEAKT